MGELAEEFCNILKDNTKSTLDKPFLDPNSSTITDSASSNYYKLHEEDYTNINTLTDDEINNLRVIAKEMSSTGYLQQCADWYTDERKIIINAIFQQLKVEKLSCENAQRLKREEFESAVRVWVRSAEICLKFIFPKERQWCGQIFNDLGNATDDDCFVKSVEDPAAQLSDVAEALSCISPSSDRLLIILELYHRMSSLLPKLDELVHSKSSKFNGKKTADELLSKLGEAVCGSLSKFEMAVRKEQTQIGPADPIHNLPRYVVKNIIKLCEYEQSLMALPLPNPFDESTSRVVAFEGRSPLSIHLIWIVENLVLNLEGKAKAKLREDASLSHFFIMNNVHYIVQKIKLSPKLEVLIGDDCMKKLNDKLNTAKADYINCTLKEVLYCMRDEGLTGRGNPSSKVSKLRLKAFNDTFEELRKSLANVVVPDSQLLLDVRNLMSRKLVSAYTSFLQHFGSSPSLQNHIKYPVVGEFETSLLGFFGRSPNPQPR